MSSLMRVEEDEAGGIAAFEALKVHEPDFAPGLDAICRTAARLFGVPIAFATLIDGSSVWLKGRFGVDDERVDRSATFCNDTIRLSKDQALVVADLARHGRYRTYDFVAGAPHARFYAGVPVVLRSGVSIGTFCLMDRVPRPEFGGEEIAQLHDLARSVEAHLHLREAQLCEKAQGEHRRRAESLLSARDHALREGDRTRQLAEMTAQLGHWRIDGGEWTITWSEGMARIFGKPLVAGKRSLDDHLSLYEPDDREVLRQRIVDAWAGRGLRSDGSTRAAAGFASATDKSITCFFRASPSVMRRERCIRSTA